MNKNGSADTTSLKLYAGGREIPFNPEMVRAEIVNGILNIAVGPDSGKYLIELSADYSKLRNSSVTSKDFTMNILFTPFQAAACSDIKFKENNSYEIVEFEPVTGSPLVIKVNSSVSCGDEVIKVSGLIKTNTPKESFIGNHLNQE